MIFGYRIAAITPPPGLESHRRQAKLTRSRLVLSQIWNVGKNKTRARHVIIHHQSSVPLWQYHSFLFFSGSIFLSGQLISVVASLGPGGLSLAVPALTLLLVSAVQLREAVVVVGPPGEALGAGARQSLCGCCGGSDTSGTRCRCSGALPRCPGTAACCEREKHPTAAAGPGRG